MIINLLDDIFGEVTDWGGKVNANMRGDLEFNIRKNLGELTGVEGGVLMARGMGHTLGDIGSWLGVSNERVRQFSAEGYRRLRHPKRIRRLTRFLSNGRSDTG